MNAKIGMIISKNTKSTRQISAILVTRAPHYILHYLSDSPLRDCE